jgi:hypothetical protein
MQISKEQYNNIPTHLRVWFHKKTDNLSGGAYAKNATERNDGWGMQRGKLGEYQEISGRYPSQTFIDSQVAEEVLGEQSKILHKCDFDKDEHDLYIYCPKVSKAERNAGCEEVKSNHPTMKPISLNEKVLKLFKTPNEQTIFIPFCGSGSEIIGAIKAGFENYIGVEINPDYIEIANARIKHYQLTTKE